MFKELESYLDRMDLIMVIKKKGDKLTVSIVPTNSQMEKLDLPPIILTASAEELDGQFATLLKSPLTAVYNNSLILKNYEDKLKAETDKKTTKPTTAPKKTDSVKSENTASAKPVEKKVADGPSLFEEEPEESDETEETPML